MGHTYYDRFCHPPVVISTFPNHLRTTANKHTTLLLLFAIPTLRDDGIRR